MASQAIASYRNTAEITSGDAACKKKIAELLKELSLPLGLLPVNDVDEFGFDRASGFIWIIQKKKVEHTFKKINEKVSYAAEVTGFAEKHKMKKLTGVKVKELFIWLTINEVYIADPSSAKITFLTGTGWRIASLWMPSVQSAERKSRGFRGDLGKNTN